VKLPFQSEIAYLIDISPLVSIEESGVYIAIGSSEILLAAVCNQGVTGAVQRLQRHKSISAGDLNAKHPLWDRAFQIIQARNCCNSVFPFLLLLLSVFLQF
jgi:hypothetical protein